jgi:hypothetical protein
LASLVRSDSFVAGVVLQEERIERFPNALMFECTGPVRGAAVLPGRGDPQAIPAWVEEGRRRSANTRRPPFSDGPRSCR